MNDRHYVPGALMRLLPAIYRDSPALPRLLAAFESVLLHQPADGQPPALGDTIARIPALVRPLDGNAAASDRTTPDDFVSWLASWVVLGRTLVTILGPDGPLADDRHPAPDGGDTRLRHVIAGVVPLYGSRGTRNHVERLLKLCLPEIRDVRIDDGERPGMLVGMSRLGSDSWLVPYRPFHFLIAVEFALEASSESHGRARQRALRNAAEVIIEWSKPAHTSYTATWQFAPRVGESPR